jgi:hypothetical protein
LASGCVVDVVDLVAEALDDLTMIPAKIFDDVQEEVSNMQTYTARFN